MTKRNCRESGSEVSTRGVCTASRIISTIGKHIVAQNALAGGSVGVGIDKSAQFGVVITGLEVVELGLSIKQLTTVEYRRKRIGELPPLLFPHIL